MNLRVILAIILLVMPCIQKANANEYESPVYTRYAAEVTSTFLKEVYKEYGFECGASGGSMPYDVEEIHLQLSADRHATLEEAREFEVKITERFVEIINSHEKIRPFLREYPFPPGRAHISIRFKKSEKFHFSKENVEYVLQTKNKIFYCAKKDNPHVYEDLYEEPYEEALKIVNSKMQLKNISKKIILKRKFRL